MKPIRTTFIDLFMMDANEASMLKISILVQKMVNEMDIKEMNRFIFDSYETFFGKVFNDEFAEDILDMFGCEKHFSKKESGTNNMYVAYNFLYMQMHNSMCDEDIRRVADVLFDDKEKVFDYIKNNI